MIIQDEVFSSTIDTLINLNAKETKNYNKALAEGFRIIRETSRLTNNHN